MLRALDRHAEQWMLHSDITGEELVRLLAAVRQAELLTEQPSKTVKLDFLEARREHDAWSYEEMKRACDEFGIDPPFDSRPELWLRAEPEFSRRLFAHVTLNHAQSIDSVRRERPPLLDDDLFDTPLTGFEPDGTLKAVDLLPLLKTSGFINAAELGFLPNYLDLIDRHEVRYACLQVALAAQAYHRQHGEFPDALTELQPQYLPELPDDPYSAEPAPVIYRRTEDNAVVYSRYTNGEDDGGTVIAYEASRGEPLDFGLRIIAPARYAAEE